ncbi:MAG: BrnA antitoxin family protein [Acetobacteraceae bacterium]|nr:BrnA antitoxin family protein [Acetobacteraceae bacterium]
MKIKYPTPEENEAIQRGIDSDPDNPELTTEEIAQMRPFSEVYPKQYAEWVRRRGPQVTPTKERISLRLDRDLLQALRAGGRGWQGRANAALRKAILGE